MLSELQTSAVLWMDLDRVKRSNITADLSSIMDDFGPKKIIVNKTADLGSSMDYFKNLTKAVNPKCRFDYDLTFHIWHVGPSVNFVKLQYSLTVQS